MLAMACIATQYWASLASLSFKSFTFDSTMSYLIVSTRLPILVAHRYARGSSTGDHSTKRPNCSRDGKPHPRTKGSISFRALLRALVSVDAASTA